MTKIDTFTQTINFNDLLIQLKQQKESIIIEDNGKAIATLINYEEWERLKQLEKQLIIDNKLEDYTLDQLLAGEIEKSEAIDWRSPQGKEIW